MYRNDKPKKKNNTLAWLVVLLFFAPQIAIPVGIVWGIIWLVKNQAAIVPKDRDRTTTRYTSRTNGRTITRTTTRTTNRYTSLNQPHGVPFDCAHKDKSFHNVRRGKEIDPWDRPDIDISKYQRRE